MNDWDAYIPIISDDADRFDYRQWLFNALPSYDMNKL